MRPAGGCPLVAAVVLWATGCSFTELAGLEADFEGRVVDSRTGDPLADARVSMAGHSERSDANGRFSFGDLEPGDYFATVEADGFESMNESVDIDLGHNAREFELLRPGSGTEGGSDADTDADTGSD